MTEITPKYIAGLEEIAHLYDGIILDLWGVVHDGIKPFADTVPAMEALKKAHRRVWILSNAPRRAHVIAERLENMGVPSTLYDGLMTAGEATWMGLRDTYLSKWGRKCYHIGPERDRNLFETLDVDIVTQPDAADFVLCSGPVDLSDTIESYAADLKAASMRNLPMICADPDRAAHVGEKLAVCAGALADVYEGMGGIVQYFGKPYRGVYTLCLKGLGVERVLAVGDGMPTDIAGATAAGVDCVLVSSGLHREHFSGTDAAEENKNRIEAFLKTYPFRPTYISEKFKW